MGSSVPFLRSVNTRLLAPLLLMGALGAACGPEPRDTAEASDSSPPLILPRANPLEKAWLVAPDKGVEWMLVPDADLDVTMTDGQININANTLFTYTIDIRNLGPDPAASTAVLVNLPSNAFFNGFSAPNFNCAPSGGVFNWVCNYKLPALAVNVPETLSFTMQSPNADDLLFVGKATVTSATTDPVPGNNVATDETVLGDNDPPANTVPGPQLVPEDTEIIFSAANGNQVLTSDPDVFDRKLRVLLQVDGGSARGRVTLSQTTGLSFINGDGTNDAVMSFEGSLANTNAALEGLRFTPARNFYGDTGLIFTVLDLGNSGFPPAHQDASVILIHISPAVNDPPDAVNDTYVIPGDSTDYPLDVLANDTWLPDAPETLTITAVTQPASGTVTFTPTGVFYTPPFGFRGVVTFDYTITDNNGGFDTATVTVTVDLPNNPPTANDDSFTVDEDSAATVLDVLANDTMAPDTGETLSVTGVTQPAGGTVTFTAADVSFTPAPNFFGPTTFTYTISDGRQGTDTATVTVMVTGLNDPPDAVDDTLSVAEDSVNAVLDVLGNDSFLPDGAETLTVTSVTQPASGTVTLNAGVVTYTPPANFSGNVTFTYTIDDGNGGTDTATVNLTVTPVNDPPAVVDDSITVLEDSAATTINVLANDSTGPETGETISVTAVTQPAEGTVTFTATQVSFTPAPNFFGTTTFTYTVTDNNGASAVGTVTVTVTGLNDAPDAVNDALSAPANTTTVLDVLANDTSLPDGPETLTITGTTQPANGSVTFTATHVSFTPNAGFRGTTTFTYTISDGNGGNDTATVTVTVVNNPPTANDDTFTVAEDSGNTSLDVLANDSIAPDTGETLRVTGVSQPAAGTASFNLSTVIFRPAANFSGPITFTYTISDGNGGTDTATVTVQVLPTNDPPTANDDSFTVPRNSGANPLNVLANDTSLPDGPEPLTITGTTQPANGTVTFTATDVSFTPAPNFVGPTSFMYTISDGNGGTASATVNVSVVPVNAPPTANDDTFTVAEDSSVTTLDVLANDSIAPDTGETLIITGVTQPANGTVTFNTSNVRFTPNANFHGPTTFDYTVSDGNGGTDTATVTVTVTPVNDLPDAVNDGFSVAEGSGATALDVLTNDSTAPDTGETLTVASVTQPTNGTVVLSGGVVSFTPAPGFSGTTTFNYTVSDGNGGTDTALVTVTVTPVNDLPTANDDSYSVVEDSGATRMNVLANDSTAPDVGETLTITSVTQPAGGTVTFTANSVFFTPTANFNGITTFTYTVSDGNGGDDTATVTVTVDAVNDAPTANDDTLTVVEDSPATAVDVLTNDSSAPDTGETISVSAVTQPANGTVTLSGGVVRFTPAANFNGPTTFTYTISDGNGGSATATVTVTVTPVNDPPTANDDAFAVAEDSGATVLDVLLNDTSTQDVGEILSITAVTQPANGTVTFTASNVSFTPAADFNGPTTFTYTISDGNGGEDTATVTVTVTPVNEPPVANDDTFTVAEDSTATSLDVLANDTTAPDTGETLTITGVTQPMNGTVSFTATRVSFTPAANFNGPTTFTYTATDGNGGSDTATVTVTVTPVNDLPTAGNDSFTVGEDSAATVLDVLANDTAAPDTGETLTITGVTQPTDGTVTFTAADVTFTPTPNFQGIATFSYTVSDGNGGSDTAAVTVTVSPVNDPPDARNDSLTVAEDSAATVLDVLANDSTAPDTGETLTV
ncbi:MAG: tandem-95 repeat protein, partial [Myxococcaceae bacterium]|nr:tandem-95 repeat protein [Myxococcaceae bacterium]